MSVFIDESLELFPTEKPQVGDLLIASPLVQQDIFNHSVLLICEHDSEEGSFALVLNKPVKFKLTELNSDIIHWDSHLYQGGPVQKNALNYVYRNLQLKNSIALFDDIYWGGDFEELDDMLSVIDENQVDIKFFIGYSGWSAHQLDYEFKKKIVVITQRLSRRLYL